MKAHNFIDMTGWVMSEHGVPDSRLIVVEQVEKRGNSKKARWLCRCSCGSDKEIIHDGSAIRLGAVRSCGCLERELTVARNKAGHETTYEEIEDGYVIHCKNSELVAYIDKEDYELVKDYTWNIRDRDNGYSGYKSITTRINNKHVALASLITGFAYCDHIDRDPLNNRRNNLREATHTENMRNCSKRKDNTSGYIGVTLDKKTGMWEAQLSVHKKCLHLGKFVEKTDALKERLRAELKYFGPEFAPQRHLFEEYGIAPFNTSQND